MEDARNFANIERRLQAGVGQALQQFMSDSPWSVDRVYDKIQSEIAAQPFLQHGGLVILDESSDETAGEDSAGAGRQHNGRLGKVALSVTTVALTYAHPASGTWVLVDGELFSQEKWFMAAYAERRAAVGLPPGTCTPFEPRARWGETACGMCRCERLPYTMRGAAGRQPPHCASAPRPAQSI